MIDIYFIRHGETDGNVAKRHQAEHTKLTKRGKEQARLAGEWAKSVTPTHFIASNRVRTLQTAQIIGESLDMIPDTNPVFTELKRPDAIYGNRHKSVRSLWYLSRWYLGYSGGDGTDSDGESYETFRNRLQEAQTVLTALPDNSRVVVVSHSVFIGFMIAHLCNKKPVGIFTALLLFKRLLQLCNGSYTHVRFDPTTPQGTCPWKLVSYNNCEHLHT